MFVQGYSLYHWQTETSSATVHTSQLDACPLAGSNVHQYAILRRLSDGDILANIGIEYILLKAHIRDASVASASRRPIAVFGHYGGSFGQVRFVVGEWNYEN